MFYQKILFISDLSAVGHIITPHGADVVTCSFQSADNLPQFGRAEHRQSLVYRQLASIQEVGENRVLWCHSFKGFEK